MPYSELKKKASVIKSDTVKDYIRLLVKEMGFKLFEEVEEKPN